MNRRDLVLLALALIWFVFVEVHFREPKDFACKNYVAEFVVSMLVLLVCYVAVVIASVVFPKFGKWGDKKLFGKKDQ